MAQPIRPNQSPGTEQPCSACGQPAGHYHSEAAPRRTGDNVARTTRERECTNPRCRFNDGSPLRAGDGP